MELAATRPDLVRRLVVAAVPPIEKLPVIKQDSLVVRIKLGPSDDSQWARGTLPHAKFIDLAEYSADLFEAAPEVLAKQVGDFLRV